jgi:hypothetical protein
MLTDSWNRLWLKRSNIIPFIECFCVHARNLLDFFWDDRAKKDHAIARHFVANTSCYKPFGGVSPKGTSYGKLNAQIVHLTYNRTDDPADKIKHEERVSLRRLIEKEIDNFSKHIEAQYRPLWKRQGQKVSSRRSPQATTTPNISITATGTIGQKST